MASDHPQCKLMEGLFADVVQLLLGAVAVSILVCKRYRERPRRPWRIWFMDVSKQGLGALFAHVLNIMISTLLSWNSTCSDEVRVTIRARRAWCERPSVTFFLLCGCASVCVVCRQFRC